MLSSYVPYRLFTSLSQFFRVFLSLSSISGAFMIWFAAEVCSLWCFSHASYWAICRLGRLILMRGLLTAWDLNMGDLDLQISRLRRYLT